METRIGAGELIYRIRKNKRAISTANAKLGKEILLHTTTFALRLAGTIFFIVAVLHALRIITGISITVDGWLVPIWLNYMGCIGSLTLCVWMWVLSNGRDKCMPENKSIDV